LLKSRKIACSLFANFGLTARPLRHIHEIETDDLRPARILVPGLLFVGGKNRMHPANPFSGPTGAMPTLRAGSVVVLLYYQ
jgi:hypothetical protein